MRAAQNDQRLNNCQAMCSLVPTYAAQNRRVPDFALPNAQGQTLSRDQLLRGHDALVLVFYRGYF